MRTVVIMGAAGRDFHDFNVVFRDDPETRVVAFTAAQIPGIENRAYPPSLAGLRYGNNLPGATVIEDPAAAVVGAHAVYTDVWVSMGEEDEREKRIAMFRPYQVTEELMAQARPEAVFMHCLPAHRGEEVAAAVIDGVRSVVWRQAENRLPTEEAILFALTTRRWNA
jgi:hypothetical protein